jgi:hypothetical protein
MKKKMNKREKKKKEKSRGENLFQASLGLATLQN